MTLAGPYIKGLDRQNTLLPAYPLDRCGWCGRKRGVTHIEFYSVRYFDSEARAYVIGYPAVRGENVLVPLIARVGHPECGPDTGYAIKLTEVIRKSVAVWDAHLRTKVWYSLIIPWALSDAIRLHGGRLRKPYSVTWLGGPRDGEERRVPFPGPMHGVTEGYRAWYLGPYQVEYRFRA
ncbi:MAG: hypothetical protein KatS3mg081_0553 [Gemmatimonadales bacterium]|nr:MAG: hypothetical protein KatS3mg081_0553 [Gemmatimonadales bacterium]